MKLHEYQAKVILQQRGVPVPKGEVAETPPEAQAIAQRLGGRAVVKAQVHAGGRGKAGGVQTAGTAQQAGEIAKKLIGSRLVTFQTGPEGVPVHKVLVEETLDIAQELYFSITTDGAARRTVVIASSSGGVEIEEVASRSPEKVLRVTVDPVIGLQPFQTRKLAYGMGLPASLVRAFADLAQRCYQVFVAHDCSLLEINPLIVSRDDRLLALDAKLNLDDDALFRHPDLQALHDPEQEDPLEREASRFDIAYVRLDGDVGCMVNGAGLAMATMDIIKATRAGPANFLDVGGGASEERVEQAFSLLLLDPNVKRVLVNIFGGILRCDVAARGIVAACARQKVNVPIVVRMLGTNVDEGRQILKESGLSISLATTLSEAAQLVADSEAPGPRSTS